MPDELYIVVNDDEDNESIIEDYEEIEEDNDDAQSTIPIFLNDKKLIKHPKNGRI